MTRLPRIATSPSDNDQQRQAAIRKMISESVRASDQRSVLIVAAEI